MSTREISIAVRAHTVIPRKEKPNFNGGKKKADLRLAYGVRVMVIDTETSTDIYQNLHFGLAVIYECPGQEDQVYVNAEEKEAYLFYGENLSAVDMVTLKEFAKEREASLISRNDFIYQVFWPEVLEYGTLCVGFNLPFDLSRLAISAKTFKTGKHKDDIEFKLCDSFFYPTVLITPIDSKKAFIKLRASTRPGTRDKRNPFRQGRFVDLRTLTFALTNESHSLKSACKLYRVEHGKEEANEHGKITMDYCRYNARDVEATFELYCKAKEEFDKHPLVDNYNKPLEAGKAFSPATIGKAYYRSMGIKPLSEIQPDFPPEVLGYAMCAYYGGRSECHYRGKPVKVYHTDVTSMYPSVFTLQNLWSWVTADNFQVVEDTEGVKSFVSGITLDKLFQKETWFSIPALVQVKPNHDLLPVRAEYTQGSGFQIGLNYLVTEEPMWYTMADIISTMILTSKTPEIIRAIRIIPGKPQEGLREIKLRGEIPINPAKDNFFKRVIELRKQVKKQVKTKGDEPDAMQLFLKILANSTSYGVYIELNREEEAEETEVQIYGLKSFLYKDKQVEKHGRYYNPLIAVMITGAARLILAMMEKTTLDLGGNFAFCDTDSMSIIDLENDMPEKIGRQVVERFKSLYPYNDPSGNSSLLEAEDYNWGRKDWTKDTDKKNTEEGKYFPLYCYMVSAKRYVLYNLIPDENGSFKPVIRKKSDHGLGHLRSPLSKKEDKSKWIDEVWLSNICREHRLDFVEPDWFYKPGMAQLSVSKPGLYNVLNRDREKPYSEQVKPFNFMLVAYPENSGSLFGGDTLITEFYCREHKAIALNGCSNKGKCKYAGGCFANLHKTPITPYADVKDATQLPWQEKNTKGPLAVKVNGKGSKGSYTASSFGPESEDNYLLTDDDQSLTIKNYSEFIKDYHLHPENKYDDGTGNKCGKLSKGLLQRTEVNAIKILHIGKETNTLQDVEEKASLPEEQDREEMILTFEQEEKKKSKSNIDLVQWRNILPILKDKAKPRKVWAERLGISERYFKQILAGEYCPSKDLFVKILTFAKENKWPKVKTSKPKPIRFKEDIQLNIMPLNWMVENLRISKETVLVELGDFIFALYGTKYLDTKPLAVKDTLKRWREALKDSVAEEKKKVAEGPLKVKGIRLSDKDRQLVELGLGDIVACRARRIKGRNYVTLCVKTKDRKVYEVLQKNNIEIFKAGLLPKGLEFASGQENIKVQRNGKSIEYGPWIGLSDSLSKSIQFAGENYKED